MRRTLLILLASTALAGGWAVAADPPAKPRPITSEDLRYAKLAVAAQQQDEDFDRVFQSLCQAVLTRADADPRASTADQARYLFGGLWLWFRGMGGKPRLQDREELANHFIVGGAFAGTWDAGRSAAYLQNRLGTPPDRTPFDLDGLAAAMLGARWVRLAASTNQNAGRQWIELWASGRYTLSKSLPKLRYGQLPAGQEPSPAKIKAFAEDAEKALCPPAAAP